MKGIGLELVRRKSVIFGDLMNETSNFPGHVETLHERVDIARISHILKSTVPEADFAFLPVLLFFFISQFSDRQFIEQSMNPGNLDSCTVSVLNLFHESFRGLTQIRKSVLIKSVKLNDFSVNHGKISTSLDQVPAKVRSELVDLLAFKTLTIAKTDHKIFCKFYVS